MNDIKELMRTTLAGMWRRRWLGVLVAWFVCLAGWAAVMYLPPVYQSSARIYVDSDTLLGPLLKGIAVESDMSRQVDFMQRTLLSRPNLDKVIRSTDLELQASDPSKRESMIAMLTRKIEVKSEGVGRNLFSVTYDSSDSHLTQAVVQSLLNIFIESNVGVTRADMDQARSFIEAQIADYERQLKQAEQRLADFKQTHLDLLNRPGGYLSSVDGARQQLMLVQNNYEDAKLRQKTVHQQLTSVPQTVTVGGGTQIIMGNGTKADLAQRVNTLQNTLSELELRYTPQHPDVIATKRALASAREQLAHAPAGSGNEGRVTTPGQTITNPVYEQMKLREVEVQADVLSAERKVEEQKTILAQLEQQSKTAPEVEAQFANLNRDYDVIKRNYTELVNRRESARMAQEVDAKSQKIDFRVIDPPQLPLKPIGPNRILYLTVVLFAGLGAGVMFTYVLSYLDDTFDTLEKLRAISTFPILGSVSFAETSVDRKRLRLRAASFAVLCVGLVIAFASILLAALPAVAT
jgi:polysaccharide chain length determinant protein (PEP-CTERM system associated)